MLLVFLLFDNFAVVEWIMLVRDFTTEVDILASLTLFHRLCEEVSWFRDDFTLSVAVHLFCLFQIRLMGETGTVEALIRVLSWLEGKVVPRILVAVLLSLSHLQLTRVPVWIAYSRYSATLTDRQVVWFREKHAIYRSLLNILGSEVTWSSDDLSVGVPTC